MSAVHWVCPSCGPHVAADEDGCCARCGADTTAAPCKGHACYTAIDSAVLAERSRILALIRGKAEEWEAENQRVMDYGGTPVLDGEVSAAHELATLIEKETP